MTTELISTRRAALESLKPSPQIDWLESVRQQVASLRFGVVQIVVHEGRVVQIERTEKIRVESKN